jgi:uncharacterized membrane protein
MAELIVARIVHVLGVVLWIGGVAMVTTVLLPATQRLKSTEEQMQFFERMEAGFARQTRWTVLITGLSGFYLAYQLDAWDRFRQASYWWMHAMVLIWGLFMLMLFVLEPLWLHRWFERSARSRPESTFRLIHRLHWVLLILSLLTIAGAVAGSHGWLLS